MLTVEENEEEEEERGRRGEINVCGEGVRGVGWTWRKEG